MLNTIKSYVLDEKAEGEVGKIIGIVLIIAVALFLGWFIWDAVSAQVNKANTNLNAGKKPSKPF